jgi:PIF1-like helicase
MCPVFLTGRAGTGKTTFLHYIRETSLKKMVVLAPTGVAAINAGGTTLHSFFQLPFGPFVPTSTYGWNIASPGYHDANSMLANIRFNKARRQLLQELELLVIDEVSMAAAFQTAAFGAFWRVAGVIHRRSLSTAAGDLRQRMADAEELL